MIQRTRMRRSIRKARIYFTRTLVEKERQKHGEQDVGGRKEQHCREQQHGVGEEEERNALLALDERHHAQNQHAA